MELEDFTGDKRTKEYRDFKAKFEANQSKGLGDTVEKIAEATGISKVVKSLFGEDCGCDERKAKLNRLVKYKVVNCLEEDEYNYVKEHLSRDSIKVTASEQRELLRIYNRVFNQKKQASNCSVCVRQTISQLKNLINSYDE